jgi:hypothetical protein
MGDSTTDPTFAYLAGVIDSDGWISIGRGRHRSGAPRWFPRVGICGTRPEPHALAVATFGGRVRSYVNRDVRYRLMLEWARSGAEAVRVLDALLPFLLVKRAQAELALEVAMVTSQQTGIGVDLTIQLDDMHAEIKTLNQWRRVHAG